MNILKWSNQFLNCCIVSHAFPPISLCHLTVTLYIQLHCIYTRNSPFENSLFLIYGTTLPIITYDKCYKYLGVPIGIEYGHWYYTCLEIYIVRPLQSQKIDAIETLIISYIVVSMRIYETKLGDLTSIRVINHDFPHIGADQKIIDMPKKILVLPNSANNSYLYTHANFGSIGLTCLDNEYYQ